MVTSNGAHMQGQAWFITGSTQGENTQVIKVTNASSSQTQQWFRVNISDQSREGDASITGFNCRN